MSKQSRSDYNIIFSAAYISHAAFADMNGTEKIKAKAIVTHELGKRTFEDVLVRQPGEGELLMDIVGAGICHTDLVEVGSQYPLIQGHEGKYRSAPMAVRGCALNQNSILILLRLRLRPRNRYRRHSRRTRRRSPPLLRLLRHLPLLQNRASSVLQGLSGPELCCSGRGLHVRE